MNITDLQAQVEDTLRKSRNEQPKPKASSFKPRTKKALQKSRAPARGTQPVRRVRRRAAGASLPPAAASPSPVIQVAVPPQDQSGILALAEALLKLATRDLRAPVVNVAVDAKPGKTRNVPRRDSEGFIVETVTEPIDD